MQIKLGAFYHYNRQEYFAIELENRKLVMASYYDKQYICYRGISYFSALEKRKWQVSDDKDSNGYLKAYYSDVCQSYLLLL